MNTRLPFPPSGFQYFREWHPDLPGGPSEKPENQILISYQVLQLCLLSQICPSFSILTSLWGKSPAQIIVTASNWGSLLLVLSILPHHSVIHAVARVTLIFFTYIFCF